MVLALCLCVVDVKSLALIDALSSHGADPHLVRRPADTFLSPVDREFDGQHALYVAKTWSRADLSSADAGSIL